MSPETPRLSLDEVFELAGIVEYVNRREEDTDSEVYSGSLTHGDRRLIASVSLHNSSGNVFVHNYSLRIRYQETNSQGDIGSGIELAELRSPEIVTAADVSTEAYQRFEKLFSRAKNDYEKKVESAVERGSKYARDLIGSERGSA